MENLDNLKDLWKNQGESKIRFTQDDISQMVQKKSSSIVRWILIISLLEFILPNLLFVFTDFETTKQFYEQYQSKNFTDPRPKKIFPDPKRLLPAGCRVG